MYSWPIVSIMLFAVMSSRSALMVAFFGGWLLLPQASISLVGLPDYTRTTSIILGVVLGISIFDSRRLSNIRLRRIDLPIIVFCVCPLASSLSNDLGFYDGCSAVLKYTINFGIPYLIGRSYFADRDGIRELALGIVIAVLWYVPLILYEWRMSPQLHRHLYGFLQTPFSHVWRFGWYRPMVFLHHGLELGLLVANATLTAFWLWRTRSVTRIGWLSAKFAALSLLAVCLLCRALNGYVVLILGLGTLYLTKVLRARIILIFIVLLPSFYIMGRVIIKWDAVYLVESVELINPKRALSLNSRIHHEITLIEKSLQRPIFGWGTWGRNRSDSLAEGARGEKSITDSYWIIILGQRGLVGLLSFGLVLLRPITLLIRRLPASEWSNPEYSPAVALSIVLLGFTVDCLANAMFSPIYLVIAGALIAYKPNMSEKELIVDSS